jgi:hypothetical protein
MEAHRVVRYRGSHIFYTVGSQMAMRLSALRAGRPLPPGRFLALFSVKSLSRPLGHIAAGSIGQIEKSNDLIENRTRDLLAFSIVPQPTTLPCATFVIYSFCVIVTENESLESSL